MRDFRRRFNEKYKEFYAFRYMVYNLLFIIIGGSIIILLELNILIAYLLIPIIIIWFIYVALPNNKIVEIRSKVVKELEVEKIVNDRYIKEFIKEKIK